MKVDVDQCERVRVTAADRDILAFLGNCPHHHVELTLVDQNTRQAWHARFISYQTPRQYFSTQSALHIAEVLSTHREADRTLIARTAQREAVIQRKLKVLSQEKARALFNAASDIPSIKFEDDWPEAVLEMAYGSDWRTCYPKLRDSAFETLLLHVASLKQALAHSQ